VCVSDDDEIIELSQSCPKKVCHDQPTSPSRFISLNMIILYIIIIKKMADTCGSVCAVCFRSIRITSLGLIHAHGPKGNRCPGSSHPPSAGVVSYVPQSDALSSNSSSSCSAEPSPIASQTHPTSQAAVLPFPLPKVVRRVPKGSREAALIKLSAIWIAWYQIIRLTPGEG
jgi:hypothetical protein